MDYSSFEPKDLLTLEHSQVFSSHSELPAFQNWRGKQRQQGAHCREGMRQEIRPLLLSSSLPPSNLPLFRVPAFPFSPTLGLEGALFSTESLPRRSSL